MTSKQYREIIRRITNAAMKRRFPGLQKGHLAELADTVARNIHARMYGANVDGVDSPLWQTDDSNKPNVNASELLKETI